MTLESNVNEEFFSSIVMQEWSVLNRQTVRKESKDWTGQEL